MKILVFSDSHGRVSGMLDAVEREKPDAIFHLGDLADDGEQVRFAYPNIPFYAVEGNCDRFSRGDFEGVARLAGKTIFYLHGHTKGVKVNTDRAVLTAFDLGADILLYGHTHRPDVQRVDTLLVVNPGAAMNGRAAALEWRDGGEITVTPVEA